MFPLPNLPGLPNIPAPPSPSEAFDRMDLFLERLEHLLILGFIGLGILLALWIIGSLLGSRRRG